MVTLKINSFIRDNVKQNFWFYVMVVFFICTGIVLGIYSVFYMDDFSSNDLKGYVISFLNLDKIEVPYISLFLEALKNNLIFLGCIWILGLTIIGVPFVLMILVIKGFSLGFTITFFVSQLGAKGAFTLLFATIVPNIIYLAILVFAGVLSVQFSMSLLKDKGSWRDKLLSNVGRYSVLFAFLLIIVCIGAAYESFVAPHIIMAIN